MPSPAGADQGSVSIEAILNIDVLAVLPHPPPHLTEVVLIGCLADRLRRDKQKQILKYKYNETTKMREKKKALPGNLKFKCFQIKIYCFVDEIFGLSYAQC